MLSQKAHLPIPVFQGRSEVENSSKKNAWSTPIMRLHMIQLEIIPKLHSHQIDTLLMAQPRSAMFSYIYIVNMNNPLEKTRHVPAKNGCVDTPLLLSHVHHSPSLVVE